MKCIARFLKRYFQYLYPQYFRLMQHCSLLRLSSEHGYKNIFSVDDCAIYGIYWISLLQLFHFHQLH